MTFGSNDVEQKRVLGDFQLMLEFEDTIPVTHTIVDLISSSLARSTVQLFVNEYNQANPQKQLDVRVSSLIENGWKFNKNMPISKLVC